MPSESIRGGIEAGGVPAGPRGLLWLVRTNTYILLAVASFFTLIPLVWLICASFKKPGDMWSYTFMPYGEPNDKLVAVKGLPEGQAFLITGAQVAIGNGSECAVVLPDAAAPVVVTLTLENDAWMVRPGPGLQSVAINNETKAEHKLRTGDVLHAGPYSLRYEEAHTPTMRNFRDLFGDFNFGRNLLNSFFLTATSTSISLILASLGGFALAKYTFKGKKVLMTIMLATMMIPGSVLLAPMYELICKMGMMNSYLGILVPGAVGAFGMLLFRQAMLGVPDDLLEAARIDGCSEIGIYWRIIMPVVRPMSGAFCLMSFMGGWNSFLWPMIVLQSDGLFTVPIALSQTIGLTGDNQYGLLMAGTLLGVLPPAVLFFMLQKEFIAGLTAGAVKG
ncbi:MAG: ABC transporter permease subunit [Planctomycetota bacterium]|nr:ABC transporter permease subunit [Planctomycetota bacterium]